MDVVYPPVVAAMRLAFAACGLRFHVEGAERVPSVGPVVIASNHASYLDFAFLGLAARPSGRYVRFLARYDVWHHPVAGPLMRGMHHIPVDRSAPAGGGGARSRHGSPARPCRAVGWAADLHRQGRLSWP